MQHWDTRLTHLALELGASAGPELHRDADKFDPSTISQALTAATGRPAIVTGTFERRLVLAQGGDGGWLAADLSGEPHASREWPGWSTAHLRVADARRWLSQVTLTDEALRRLTHPRLLLAALYHPEHFPLPRFPLGISDLARAARTTLLGQVRLVDMQLGVALAGILEEVRAWQPEIVGVSATFGQHDLLAELLDHLFSLGHAPLVLAGGSLTARNERMLLERYPRLLLARGAGEETIQDVLAYWHGDRDLAGVRGVGYRGAPGVTTLPTPVFRRTATSGNRARADIFPELDLLASTFTHQGVAQLETSRGCTNYCSFCPRGHKGSWSGAAPSRLPWIIDGFGEVFDRHPDVARILYLVDEEFIGRDGDAATRAVAVAQTLHRRGFRWETSCRVDQVADPSRSPAWHADRVGMWRELLRLGLRRCLFGLESGVTSILERFQKETTSEQNALAVRTLTALGVPARFTYITFDHLMSLEELRATYRFMRREDLVLRPQPHLPAAEVVAAVRDTGFVRDNAERRPLYHDISYMLVSMECLIGAAYTKRVEAAGLTRGIRPAMGRVDADYLDPRIGLCSHHAQLWIDRNFALDYTLKSLEKRLTGQPYRAVRDARAVIKDSAFTLLGGMLSVLERPAPPGTGPRLEREMWNLMDHQLDRLRARLAAVISPVAAALPGDARAVLEREYRLWLSRSTWALINAADPCGT